MAVLAAAALAVALVGGGSGCDSAGYPDTPDCVAREFVTRTDPSRCDLVEPALLEQITGARGTEARRRCTAAAAASDPPDEVEVIERETIGDTVVVELLSDGREGKITLTQGGGRWRISSFDE